MCGDIVGHHNDCGMLPAFGGQGTEVVHGTLNKM